MIMPLTASHALRLFAMRYRLRHQWPETALSHLQTIDPDARVLPPNEVLVSCEVIRRLWEWLPDEYEACHFQSLAQQHAAVEPFMKQFGENCPVILHLGHSSIGFATTLRAAWFAWDQFCDLTTETYNVCIYSRNFEWYVVRAGRWHVYPMDCTVSDQPQLAPHWFASVSSNLLD